jgi:hypothetical protein
MKQIMKQIMKQEKARSEPHLAIVHPKSKSMVSAFTRSFSRFHAAARMIGDFYNRATEESVNRSSGRLLVVSIALGLSGRTARGLVRVSPCLTLRALAVI